MDQIQDDDRNRRGISKEGNLKKNLKNIREIISNYLDRSKPTTTSTSVSISGNKFTQPIRDHLKFVGPGIVAAVAYADPGNWATDLEAGSKFGYCHLFVVFLASSMAILLQILAAKLGYITGEDLAKQCRTHLHSRKKNKMLWRWGCLYPLYVIAEAGIIMTDLAELLGSAIALNILIPKLPLWAGVLLTSLDVFVVLLFFNSYPSAANQRAMILFEFMIAVLVLFVLAAFIFLTVQVKPNWGDTFEGFLPQKCLFQRGGLYLAVSMIGATVMPHALFLGSKVAIVDRWIPHFRPKVISFDGNPDSPPLKSSNFQTFSGSQPSGGSATLEPSCLGPREQISDLDHTKRHLLHSSVDIAVSLLLVALPINAAIVIVAATAFHFNQPDGAKPIGDLYSAQQLLKEKMGSFTGYVFAVTLLVAGQAASITVTLAGQAVSEGFLEWRTNPVFRRLITRCIGIVPSAIVAASVGRKGVDSMLIVSQVGLSLALPFVIGPLIIFTASPKIMSVYVSMEEICQKFTLKSKKKDKMTEQRNPILRNRNDELEEDNNVNSGRWTNGLQYDELARMDSPIVTGELRGEEGERSDQGSKPNDLKANDDEMVGEDDDDGGNNRKKILNGEDQVRILTYSLANSKLTIFVTGAIFMVIVAANIYALVEVAKGED